MKITIVLAHPRPGSFNHAIAQTAADALRQAGHAVTLHDLYAEGFDPLYTAEELSPQAPLPPMVKAHCDELVEAEGLIIVHPNWWAMPPAILKGWLDRVLRMGIAYRFGPNASGQIGPIGLLKVRTAVVFTTSNTPRDQELALYGDPLENLWKTCICGFCGIRDARRRNFEPIIVSTPDQRQQWLAEVRDLVSSAFAG